MASPWEGSRLDQRPECGNFAEPLENSRTRMDLRESSRTFSQRSGRVVVERVLPLPATERSVNDFGRCQRSEGESPAASMTRAADAAADVDGLWAARPLHGPGADPPGRPA